MLPVVYAAILMSNLMLLAEVFYRWTIGVQVGLLVTALTSHFFPGLRKATPFVVMPYTICFLTWATVVGFVRFATGRQGATWDRSI